MGEVTHKVHLVHSAHKKAKCSPSSRNSAVLLSLELDLQQSIIQATTQFERSLVNEFAFNCNPSI